MILDFGFTKMGALIVLLLIIPLHLIGAINFKIEPKNIKNYQPVVKYQSYPAIRQSYPAGPFKRIWHRGRNNPRWPLNIRASPSKGINGIFSFNRGKNYFENNSINYYSPKNTNRDSRLRPRNNLLKTTLKNTRPSIIITVNNHKNNNIVRRLHRNNRQKGQLFGFNDGYFIKSRHKGRNNRRRNWIKIKRPWAHYQKDQLFRFNGYRFMKDRDRGIKRRRQKRTKVNPKGIHTEQNLRGRHVNQKVKRAILAPEPRSIYLKQKFASGFKTRVESEEELNGKYYEDRRNINIEENGGGSEAPYTFDEDNFHGRRSLQRREICDFFRKINRCIQKVLLCSNTFTQQNQVSDFGERPPLPYDRTNCQGSNYMYPEENCEDTAVGYNSRNDFNNGYSAGYNTNQYDGYRYENPKDRYENAPVYSSSEYKSKENVVDQSNDYRTSGSQTEYNENPSTTTDFFMNEKLQNSGKDTLSGNARFGCTKETYSKATALNDKYVFSEMDFEEENDDGYDNDDNVLDTAGEPLHANSNLNPYFSSKNYDKSRKHRPNFIRDFLPLERNKEKSRNEARQFGDNNYYESKNRNYAQSPIYFLPSDKNKKEFGNNIDRSGNNDYYQSKNRNFGQSPTNFFPPGVNNKELGNNNVHYESKNHNDGQSPIRFLPIDESKKKIGNEIGPSVENSYYESKSRYRRELSTDDDFMREPSNRHKFSEETDPHPPKFNLNYFKKHRKTESPRKRHPKSIIEKVIDKHRHAQYDGYEDLDQDNKGVHSSLDSQFTEDNFDDLDRSSRQNDANEEPIKPESEVDEISSTLRRPTIARSHMDDFIPYTDHQSNGLTDHVSKNKRQFDTSIQDNSYKDNKKDYKRYSNEERRTSKETFSMNKTVSFDNAVSYETASNHNRVTVPPARRQTSVKVQWDQSDNLNEFTSENDVLLANSIENRFVNKNVRKDQIIGGQKLPKIADWPGENSYLNRVIVKRNATYMPGSLFHKEENNPNEIKVNNVSFLLEVVADDNQFLSKADDRNRDAEKSDLNEVTNDEISSFASSNTFTDSDIDNRNNVTIIETKRENQTREPDETISSDSLEYKSSGYYDRIVKRERENVTNYNQSINYRDNSPEKQTVDKDNNHSKSVTNSTTNGNVYSNDTNTNYNNFISNQENLNKRNANFEINNESMIPRTDSIGYDSSYHRFTINQNNTQNDQIIVDSTNGYLRSINNITSNENLLSGTTSMDNHIINFSPFNDSDNQFNITPGGYIGNISRGVTQSASIVNNATSGDALLVTDKTGAKDGYMETTEGLNNESDLLITNESDSDYYIGMKHKNEEYIPLDEENISSQGTIGSSHASENSPVEKSADNHPPISTEIMKKYNQTINNDDAIVNNSRTTGEMRKADETTFKSSINSSADIQANITGGTIYEDSYPKRKNKKSDREKEKMLLKDDDAEADNIVAVTSIDDKIQRNMKIDKLNELFNVVDAENNLESDEYHQILNVAKEWLFDDLNATKNNEDAGDGNDVNRKVEFYEDSYPKGKNKNLVEEMSLNDDDAEADNIVAVTGMDSIDDKIQRNMKIDKLNELFNMVNAENNSESDEYHQILNVAKEWLFDDLNATKNNEDAGDRNGASRNFTSHSEARILEENQPVRRSSFSNDKEQDDFNIRANESDSEQGLDHQNSSYLSEIESVRNSANQTGVGSKSSAVSSLPKTSKNERSPWTNTKYKSIKKINEKVVNWIVLNQGLNSTHDNESMINETVPNRIDPSDRNHRDTKIYTARGNSVNNNKTVNIDSAMNASNGMNELRLRIKGSFSRDKDVGSEPADISEPDDSDFSRDNTTDANLRRTYRETQKSKAHNTNCTDGGKDCNRTSMELSLGTYATGHNRNRREIEHAGEIGKKKQFIPKQRKRTQMLKEKCVGGQCFTSRKLSPKSNLKMSFHAYWDKTYCGGWKEFNDIYGEGSLKLDSGKRMIRSKKKGKFFFDIKIARSNKSHQIFAKGCEFPCTSGPRKMIINGEKKSLWTSNKYNSEVLSFISGDVVDVWEPFKMEIMSPRSNCEKRSGPLRILLDGSDHDLGVMKLAFLDPNKNGSLVNSARKPRGGNKESRSVGKRSQAISKHKNSMNQPKPKETVPVSATLRSILKRTKKSKSAKRLKKQGLYTNASARRCPSNQAQSNTVDNDQSWPHSNGPDVKEPTIFASRSPAVNAKIELFRIFGKFQCRLGGACKSGGTTEILECTLLDINLQKKADVKDRFENNLRDKIRNKAHRSDIDIQSSKCPDKKMLTLSICRKTRGYGSKNYEFTLSLVLGKFLLDNTSKRMEWFE